MAELTCISNWENISNELCSKAYGPVKSVFLLKSLSEITDMDTAILEATWENLINSADADRLYVLNGFREVEWENGEDAVNEDSFGGKLKMVSGNRSMTGYYWETSRTKLRNLKKMDGSEAYVFLVTQNGYILGVSSDETKFTPMKTQVWVGAEIAPANRTENWRLPFTIDFKEPDNVNTYAVLPTAFDANDLDGIVNVDLATSSPTTSSVTVTVTGEADGREVSGLVADDFTLLDDAGDSVSISSVTSSGNVYTVNATMTSGDYTINLVNQPSMTTKGYESTGATSFTVS